jgi:hypothetical protein
MDQKKNYMKRVTYLFLAGLFFCACGKQDSNYYQYIKDGPIVYPGKADSVVVGAGNGRARITWWMSSGQTVTSCKVFWAFGQDSVVVPLGKSRNTDTVSIIIDSLSEGSYNFTVYTYDDAGNKSVPTSGLGNVYGPTYISTLVNRPIRSAQTIAAGNEVDITWVGLDINCLGTQWMYTGTDGLAKTYFSSIGDTTEIAPCNTGAPVSYRSLFIPEINAIDTFYTNYTTL